MGNYTRRSKSILSLIVVLICLQGCCPKYNSQPPAIPVLDTLNFDYPNNRPQLIITWYNNEVIYDNKSVLFLDNLYKEYENDSLINIQTKTKITKDSYFLTPIKEVLKNYRIKDGYLLDMISNNNSKIEVLRFDTGDYVDFAELDKGKIQTSYRIYKNSVDFGSSEGISFDEKGNIGYQYNGILDMYIKVKTKDSIKLEKLNPLYHRYRNIFNKGNGFWKTYYYGKMYNYEYISGPIKEEGEVKNNFKYGEWKYYNNNGAIDSTKTYTLKDSVDVRFPHCIFNKKEPCYSKNKIIK